MASSAPSNTNPATPARPYTAEEVAGILRVGVPTVYEWSRATPDLIGAFRVGRAVRFRKHVVDELVDGR
jgi:excisionase family DNA binding protein